MRKNITTLAEQLETAVPKLSFTAYYDADDPMLNASMRLYKKRAFVYVLAIDFHESEEYIYAGKSAFQYARMLQHIVNFSFSRVYLFECEETALEECEEAVIKLLRPIFNRQHNPNAIRYQRVLHIDYDVVQDKETTLQYLEKWHAYCEPGLYGFAIPPVLYSILKNDAAAHNHTVGQELTHLLEAVYADELCDTSVGEMQMTNLVTTIAYGSIHGKSQEQIKQYLHQKNRLAGQKIGNVWLIPDDEAFPEDRRERATMY